ncbi:mannose-1-phosphate guanylyltransferase/mannose-6-phosphate isomerase [Desulforamulus ruminis]|uniref:mannose-1-phosphate guanylyltransferase n=1 Tax=Desulforamulus ruminis (strain ATCC 23193 / DSM 2154 / NCIMB 8452 / DL) TaxID=696281 RepID=F6DP45_DESRL|nr:mannose-1-phosphate guanylyltransferase/mannose-6-phosphate isomerase [Desulforamulus ruminis]AEG61874.1 mannose-1-phosphate guanylyltransferase/mannose-6-phosphate isomerase [Desulforamulus ruminis DSM 2154]
MVKLIVLAGGGGTRLFPVSRTSYPKQFLKLATERSLLIETLKRFEKKIKPENMIIVTNKEYKHHVLSELKAYGFKGVHVILEPTSRNTAPAIALAVQYCKEVLNAGESQCILVTPSDHIIKPGEAMVSATAEAIALSSKGYFTTFGVVPDKPETGYGYIKAYKENIKIKHGEIKCFSAFEVEKFVEKPTKEKAEEYFASGEYYWNSGMFAFTIGTFFKELEVYCPDIYHLIQQGYAPALKHFDQMPNISIDYALAERSHLVAVIPLQLKWSDVGSWDALYEILEKDNEGNALTGDCVTVDCRNSMLVASDRLVAAVGLDETIIVETNDAIVVAKKGESQKIKDLVGFLKNNQRKEVSEHTTTYRPWGSYTILTEGSGFKVKRIMVLPGERLSLQMHYHRSEHWVVIAGTAKVTIGEQEIMVHESESVFVPKSTKHCLENPGKIPLEIIEVQTGTYLEEDDIVRFDDIYGRIDN